MVAAGATLVVLLGAGGVSVAATGSFSQAVADLRGDVPTSSQERVVAARTEVTPQPAPTADEPAAPSRFRVVAGSTLRRAPELGASQRARPRTRSRLADRVEKVGQEMQEPAGIPEFSVAMINILGSNHTRGGRGGYGPGTNRAATATRMLLARDASIIGFSEIQRDQLAVFRNNAPAYGVYPGTVLGGGGVPQTLAWDTADWELVEAHSISIPFSGQVRPQPVVKLASTATGREVWVMNVHNSPQGMEGERNRAEGIEIAEINRLAATGVPIIVTGDFNEKQEVLCHVTGSTPLESAIGGGNCFPPPQQMRVDWIFASPELTRSSYDVTRAAPIPSITDHAVLFSRLSIP